MEKMISNLFYYTHKTLKLAKLDSIMYMSNSPIDHIIDNIYLGDFRAADDINILKDNGITHIINCAKLTPEQYIGDFEYISLNLRDNLSQNISDAIELSLKFIRNANNNSNSKIFIHCRQGVSRSVAMVLAYIMVEKKMSFENSLVLIKSKRNVSNPNNYFSAQLIELEKEISKNEKKNVNEKDDI